MDFVSILVDLFRALVELEFFQVFVGALGVSSLWSLTMHIIAGKRVFYL